MDSINDLETNYIYAGILKLTKELHPSHNTIYSAELSEQGYKPSKYHRNIENKLDKIRSLIDKRTCDIEIVITPLDIPYYKILFFLIERSQDDTFPSINLIKKSNPSLFIPINTDYKKLFYKKSNLFFIHSSNIKRETISKYGIEVAKHEISWLYRILNKMHERKYIHNISRWKGYHFLGKDVHGNQIFSEELKSFILYGSESILTDLISNYFIPNEISLIILTKEVEFWNNQIEKGSNISIHDADDVGINFLQYYINQPALFSKTLELWGLITNKNVLKKYFFDYLDDLKNLNSDDFLDYNLDFIFNDSNFVTETVERQIPSIYQKNIVHQILQDSLSLEFLNQDKTDFFNSGIHILDISNLSTRNTALISMFFLAASLQKATNHFIIYNGLEFLFDQKSSSKFERIIFTQLHYNCGFILSYNQIQANFLSRFDLGIIQCKNNLSDNFYNELNLQDLVNEEYPILYSNYRRPTLLKLENPKLDIPYQNLYSYSQKLPESRLNIEPETSSIEQKLTLIDQELEEPEFNTKIEDKITIFSLMYAIFVKRGDETESNYETIENIIDLNLKSYIDKIPSEYITLENNQFSLTKYGIDYIAQTFKEIKINFQDFLKNYLVNVMNIEEDSKFFRAKFNEMNTQIPFDEITNYLIMKFNEIDEPNDLLSIIESFFIIVKTCEEKYPQTYNLKPEMYKSFGLYLYTLDTLGKNRDNLSSTYIYSLQRVVKSVTSEINNKISANVIKDFNQSLVKNEIEIEQNKEYELSEFEDFAEIEESKEENLIKNTIDNKNTFEIEEKSNSLGDSDEKNVNQSSSNLIEDLINDEMNSIGPVHQEKIISEEEYKKSNSVNSTYINAKNNKKSEKTRNNNPSLQELVESSIIYLSQYQDKSNLMHNIPHGIWFADPDFDYEQHMSKNINSFELYLIRDLLKIKNFHINQIFNLLDESVLPLSANEFRYYDETNLMFLDFDFKQFGIEVSNNVLRLNRKYNEFVQTEEIIQINNHEEYSKLSDKIFNNIMSIIKSKSADDFDYEQVKVVLINLKSLIRYQLNQYRKYRSVIIKEQLNYLKAFCNAIQQFYGKTKMKISSMHLEFILWSLMVLDKVSTNKESEKNYKFHLIDNIEIKLEILEKFRAYIDFYKNKYNSNQNRKIKDKLKNEDQKIHRKSKKQDSKNHPSKSQKISSIKNIPQPIVKENEKEKIIDVNLHLKKSATKNETEITVKPTEFQLDEFIKKSKSINQKKIRKENKVIYEEKSTNSILKNQHYEYENLKEIKENLSIELFNFINSRHLKAIENAGANYSIIMDIIELTSSKSLEGIKGISSITAKKLFQLSNELMETTDLDNFVAANFREDPLIDHLLDLNHKQINLNKEQIKNSPELNKNKDSSQLIPLSQNILDEINNYLKTLKLEAPQVILYKILTEIILPELINKTEFPDFNELIIGFNLAGSKSNILTNKITLEISKIQDLYEINENIENNNYLISKFITKLNKIFNDFRYNSQFIDELKIIFM